MPIAAPATRLPPAACRRGALAALLVIGCGNPAGGHHAGPPRHARATVATCGQPVPAPAPTHARAASPTREPMPWDTGPPTASTAPRRPAEPDAQVIARAFRARQAGVVGCVSARDADDLAGAAVRVEVRVAVEADGRVRGVEVRADEVDAALLACVCAELSVADFRGIGAATTTSLRFRLSTYSRQRRW